MMFFDINLLKSEKVELIINDEYYVDLNEE